MSSINRRDFIAGAGAILATGAIARPVRSLLSNRDLIDNILMPTAADYVQNGLVAMYDGIENAGFGVHDSLSPIWKDLSPCGRDLQQKGSADVVFGDDFAHFSKGAYFQGNLPEMYDGVIDGEFTAETIFRITAPESTNASLFGLGWSDGRTLWIYANINSNIQANCFDSVGGIPCGESNLGIINSIAFTGDGIVYLNGVPYTTAQISTITRLSRAEFSLGKLPQLFDYMIGDIFSVRAYARTLTPDEIAYNHSIDQMRFGL